MNRWTDRQMGSSPKYTLKHLDLTSGSRCEMNSSLLPFLIADISCGSSHITPGASMVHAPRRRDY
jgi:hypothetical protein